MLTAIGAWLFNTQLGRTVLLCGVVAITTLALWWLFADHYRDEGYAKCQAEHTAALNEANVRQAEENTRNDETSNEIASDTDKAGAVVAEDVTRANTEATKEIVYVYLDPPRTEPVAAGSCVHPVDDRVQRRIDQAVHRANEARGTLQAAGG